MGRNGRGVCPLDSTDLVLFHPKGVSIFSITSAGWEMEVPVQHWQQLSAVAAWPCAGLHPCLSQPSLVRAELSRYPPLPGSRAVGSVNRLLSTTKPAQV